MKRGFLLLISALFLAEAFSQSSSEQKCTTRRNFNPIPKSDQVFYDYIVVGGGTAGSVVASRLAEDPSVQVLLLEQGGDLQDPTLNNIFIQELLDSSYCDPNVNPVNGTCPATSLPLHLSNTPLMCAWASHTDAAMQNYITPQVYAGMQQLQYPRGGVLGGSSEINYMVAIRGMPYDFDTLWSQQEKLENWTYKDVLPFFRKMETAYDVPRDAYHGDSGPICITKSSRFWPSPMWNAIQSSAQKQGYPVTNDFHNATSFYGVGEQTVSICPDGRRSSTRSHIKRLQTKNQICFGDYRSCPSSTNLHIVLWATAIKVEFDTSVSPPRAIGVRYVDSKAHPYMARTYHPTMPFTAREAAKFRADFSTWDKLTAPLGMFSGFNETFTSDQAKWRIRPDQTASLQSVSRVYYASREIILAAGNFQTPQLLMLSGIGPANHLNASDIPVLADLPVGLNLEDHDEYFMIYKQDDPSNVYWNVNDAVQHVGAWLAGDKSPLSSNHGPGSLDISSTGGIPETHNSYFQFYYENLDNSAWRNHDPRVIIPRSLGDIFTWKGLQYSSWVIATAHRCAKGSVRLKNKDPLQVPLIDLNLGACRKTMKEMIFATREIRKIMAALPAPYTATEIFPGPSVQSDEDLENAIRSALWGHQSCCSVPMGPCDGPRSVNDYQGRVFQVSGLRVADISTFPTIPIGNTWITTAMVGEKIAEHIKQLYKGVRGHLFNDLNGDGAQQVGEKNLVNVQVRVSDSKGNIWQTSTDSLGEWSVNATGNLTVDITMPSNSGLNSPQITGSGSSFQISVSPGSFLLLNSTAVRDLSTTTSSGLSGGQIAGIVLGTVAAAALIALVVIGIIFMLSKR